jgi:hypothetical protein
VGKKLTGDVAALEVIDGEAPVGGNGEGNTDGVQRRMAISKMWLATTSASRGDGERRLEAGDGVGCRQRACSAAK